MTKHSEMRWIIVSHLGLAYGAAWDTRVEAIVDHVNFVDPVCRALDERGQAWLTPSQRSAWDRCKRKGDRAIKATLSWDVSR